MEARGSRAEGSVSFLGILTVRRRTLRGTFKDGEGQKRIVDRTLLPNIIARRLEEFASAHHHSFLGFCDALLYLSSVILEHRGQIESAPCR